MCPLFYHSLKLNSKFRADTELVWSGSFEIWLASTLSASCHTPDLLIWVCEKIILPIFVDIIQIWILELPEKIWTITGPWVELHLSTYFTVIARFLKYTLFLCNIPGNRLLLYAAAIFFTVMLFSSRFKMKRLSSATPEMQSICYYFRESIFGKCGGMWFGENFYHLKI